MALFGLGRGDKVTFENPLASEDGEEEVLTGTITYAGDGYHGVEWPICDGLDRSMALPDDQIIEVVESRPWWRPW